jgi:sugar phosphate isomerase/epimerase
MRTSITRRGFAATLAGAAAAGAQAAARSGLGLSPDCFVIARPPRTPYEYLQYGYDRGAGGVQAVIPPNVDSEYLKKTRERVEQLGIYLEITTMLPDNDTAQFEAVVKAARECGATCLRSVCLRGRRYETFNSLEEWKTFVTESHRKLQLAAQVVERHKFPLGIETHKDWTVEEMVPLMRQFGSEYVGACPDFGNNLALLDDPVEVAEALAPYTVMVHIKDMAVEEYPDGFLLSEVALGQGFLDLKRMVDAIRRVRPKAHFSLDMLTRDPLKVPCLTEKYWATFVERNGKYLARTLRAVRANKPRKPLAILTGMEQQARLDLEQANVRESVSYARDVLGLRHGA